jgi:hypothetical protein
MTNSRNESLREPLRNKCLGPKGLGIEAAVETRQVGKKPVFYPVCVGSGAVVGRLTSCIENEGRAAGSNGG